MRLKTDNRFHKLEVTMRQVQADVDDMKEVTKKELFERANEHEEAIFQIKKALEQHGIKWTDEPKLKQLDQSVFDDEPPHLKWAAVEEDGGVYLFALKPFIDLRKWAAGTDEIEVFIDHGYDASNWQNSLIERKELTGSDLTEQIMKSQKYQPAFVSDESEQDAINSQRTALIDNVYMSDRYYRFRAELNGYRYAVPINNQGEPLTAAEAGL